jgi:hypothetical protein
MPTSEGVVVFDKLLAAQGMHDGGFQLARKFDQLLVSSGAAGSGENRRLLRVIQNLRQRAISSSEGHTVASARENAARPLLDGISQSYVARQAITATPRREIAVCMAISSTRGICSAAKPVRNSGCTARRDVPGGSPGSIRCRFRRWGSAPRWPGREPGCGGSRRVR